MYILNNTSPDICLYSKQSLLVIKPIGVDTIYNPEKFSLLYFKDNLCKDQYILLLGFDIILNLNK